MPHIAPARDADITRVLTDHAASGGGFALLHRPRVGGERHVDVLCGAARAFERIADLPIPAAAGPARADLLVLVPYRQIAERGFDCHDDGVPLIAMPVETAWRIRRRDLIAALPARAPALTGGAFDLPDEAYAQIVRDVLAHEIGAGEGSNFVIRRAFTADLDGDALLSALALYRRLLAAERGAHWTFLIHTGDRTLVGATPERHVDLRRAIASMSPISGTYRYRPHRVDVRGVLRFLHDRKEIDELAMVLDEELKMMARICSAGGRVRGPYLRQMAALAHTEYAISGRTDLDVRQVLRESLLAPPVVGSPLENACRVIRRHETSGRGYYSGVAALIGHDDDGAATMDSAILIRAADIDRRGRLRIDVGATLVRHSRPEAEAAETTAKAAALLAALGETPAARPRASLLRRGALAVHPLVARALRDRNATLSRFWLGSPGSEGDRGRGQDRGSPDHGVAGLRVTIFDAEDMFTGMLAHQLCALGVTVAVRHFSAPPPRRGDCDVVVLGPGPGDPRRHDDVKIAAMRGLAHACADQGLPLLGLCLGHQVVAGELGFELVARAIPNQGAQRHVDLFGRPRRVGFYNTFAATSDRDRVMAPGWGPVDVSRDPATGEVHALRAATLGSFQFHPESVLTTDGPAILGQELDRLRAVTG